MSVFDSINENKDFSEEEKEKLRLTHLKVVQIFNSPFLIQVKKILSVLFIIIALLLLYFWMFGMFFYFIFKDGFGPGYEHWTISQIIATPIIFTIIIFLVALIFGRVGLFINHKNITKSINDISKKYNFLFLISSMLILLFWIMFTFFVFSFLRDGYWGNTFLIIYIVFSLLIIGIITMCLKIGLYRFRIKV